MMKRGGVRNCCLQQRCPTKRSAALGVVTREPRT
jgi:hypothetical protein